MNKTINMSILITIFALNLIQIWTLLKIIISTFLMSWRTLTNRKYILSFSTKTTNIWWIWYHTFISIVSYLKWVRLVIIIYNYFSLIRRYFLLYWIIKLTKVSLMCFLFNYSSLFILVFNYWVSWFFNLNGLWDFNVIIIFLLIF